MTATTVPILRRSTSTKDAPLENRTIRVRPYYPDMVELRQGRRQMLLTLPDALMLADTLADTVETVDAAEDRVQTAFDSRPTYSTGDPL